jgi:hypothetical protein
MVASRDVYLAVTSPQRHSLVLLLFLFRPGPSTDGVHLDKLLQTCSASKMESRYVESLKRVSDGQPHIRAVEYTWRPKE